MQREQTPACCPAQQVSLALQVMHIRKKASNQRSGNQERQRNETEIDHRFSFLRLDSRRPHLSLCPGKGDVQLRFSATRAGTCGLRSVLPAQNKVLAIMSQEKLAVQAY